MRPGGEHGHCSHRETLVFAADSDIIIISLPVAIGLGVSSAYVRNEYHKNASGE
jgi:hypothetical protein